MVAAHSPVLLGFVVATYVLKCFASALEANVVPAVIQSASIDEQEEARAVDDSFMTLNFKPVSDAGNDVAKRHRREVADQGLDVIKSFEVENDMGQILYVEIYADQLVPDEPETAKAIKEEFTLNATSTDDTPSSTIGKRIYAYPTPGFDKTCEGPYNWCKRDDPFQAGGVSFGKMGTQPATGANEWFVIDTVKSLIWQNYWSFSITPTQGDFYWDGASRVYMKITSSCNKGYTCWTCSTQQRVNSVGRTAWQIFNFRDSQESEYDRSLRCGLAVLAGRWQGGGASRSTAGVAQISYYFTPGTMNPVKYGSCTWNGLMPNNQWENE